MTDAPILVIGSTGKTGRRIVEKLTGKGLPVRHGSRQSATPFDWDRPETWPAALAGVRSVYVSYYPDLAVPGAPEKIAELIRCAADVGAGRLVLLSGRGETQAQASEAILRDSGLDHTLIRAAWFAQNFSEGALLGPVLDGVIALPAGSVREPIVDADDIADVAVAALTEDRHSGALYEVTGPELLGFDEMAATLSTVVGRPVAYQPISLDQFRTAMAVAAGEALADVLTAVCRETLGGRNAYLGKGVREALGREPRDFTSFCRSAAAAGAWKAAA